MPSSTPTPLGFLARGFVAAALGTAAMDAVQYARHRAGGGAQGVWEWETSRGLAGWEDAPAPAQVGRRLVEGLFGRSLPANRARPMNNVMHWMYGTSCGGMLGLTAGSSRVPAPVLGPLFGAAVWCSSYALLGAMGLYKPIWEYEPAVLARDLGDHLVYGAASGTAMAVLRRV